MIPQSPVWWMRSCCRRQWRSKALKTRLGRLPRRRASSMMKSANCAQTTRVRHLTDVDVLHSFAYFLVQACHVHCPQRQGQQLQWKYFLFLNLSIFFTFLSIDILKIDHLWQFTSLTKLQLDNNIIEKIEGLGCLTNLKWLGKKGLSQTLNMFHVQ